MHENPFHCYVYFIKFVVSKTSAVNIHMTAVMFHSISSGKSSCIFGFLTCNQEFTCLKMSFSANHKTAADNFCSGVKSPNYMLKI